MTGPVRIFALLAMFVAWSFALVPAASAQSAAAKRHALVIGNADYPAQPGRLMRPGQDADAIAAALRAAGFSVTVLKDGGQGEIIDAVDKLRARLAAAGPEAVGFFYYSGHGASAEVNGRRRNYLMPARTEVSSADQLALRGIALDQVIDGLSTARAKAVFVVSDACRNTLPWSASKGGEQDKAFGIVDRRSGVYVAFAAADGQTTPDDGYFAQALARTITTPAVTADRAFTLALRDVARRRPGEKAPFSSDGLTGDVCFVSCPGAPPPTGDPAQSEAQKDIDAYGAALAADTIEAFEAYRKAWPGGRFIDAASRRIEALRVARLASATVKTESTASAPQPAPAATSASLPDARRLPASTPAPVLASGQRLSDFAAFRDCADCLDMVALPGGSFTMGSPSGETGRFDDEAQVDITLGRFAISRFPVTRGQYAAFARATGRGTSGGCRTDRATKGSWADDPQGSWADPAFAQTDRHPVVCVNWDDANAFARWMSERTGKSYRLLSEAEYEYANRGGTTTPYWWGYDGNGGCGSANGADASAKRAFPGWTTSTCDDGYERTSPVGAFAANPFGLFDMTGNVWSWTADCYNKASAARPRDGRPDTSGDCSSRVLRGGSWNNDPQFLRSAYRDSLTPTGRSSYIGFRLARTVSPSDR